MSKTGTKVLRCFADRSEGQWTAVCLEFSLAAQADTVEEAISGLQSQIESYILDAYEGDDVDHRDALLNRKAPFSLWVQYYAIKCRMLWHSFTRRKPRLSKVFNPKVGDLVHS